MMYAVSCKPDQISHPELVATTTCNPAALGPVQLQRQSSHTVKKSPKYSGLSYHPSSGTDHHWSQHIGSDKPQVLNLSALRYKSFSEPRKRGVRGNHEERNEFHREVKGKFGFQAGMWAGWSDSFQHLWSTLATCFPLLYGGRLA